MAKNPKRKKSGNNVATNSIKTLKTAHIKKKIFFLNGEELETVSANKTSKCFVIKGGECNEPIFTVEVKPETPTGKGIWCHSGSGPPHL